MGPERMDREAEPAATQDRAPPASTSVAPVATLSSRAAAAALSSQAAAAPSLSADTLAMLGAVGGNAAVVRYLEERTGPDADGPGGSSAASASSGGPAQGALPEADGAGLSPVAPASSPATPGSVGAASVSSGSVGPASSTLPGEEDSARTPVASASATASTGGAGTALASSGGSAPSTLDGSAATSAPPVPVAPDADPLGTLQAVAGVPASRFPGTVAAVRGGSAAAMGRQRSAVAATMPRLPAPTGLTPAANPRPGGASVATAPAVEPPAAGGRAGAEPDLTHPVPATPAPGSQPGPALREPPPDDDQGGGWWSWLTGGIARFFGSLSTTDPAVDTSAGPRPRIDLTGDADPGQSAAAQAAGQESVGPGREAADTATTEPHGEAGIAPTPRTPRTLIAPLAASATAAAGAEIAPLPVVPPDLLAAMDTGGTELLAAEAAKHAEMYATNQAEFAAASETARHDEEQMVAAESAATTAEQRGLTEQARADISLERAQWQRENQEIEQRFATQSTARRREVEGEIQAKVAETHAEAATQLTAAETKADAEKRAAEAEAARHKKEAEDKPRSWWERAKGAISDAFDAIRSVVHGIFDRLRSVVRTIIEAAKTAVHALIEAARTVVKGLIQGFGMFVKGLVSVALAAFPEAAARARGWIDARVDAATAAVDRAADALEARVQAILDRVGAAVEAALSLLESAYLLALDALEFLAKGPFELIELLAKFGRWIAENGQFIEGARKVIDDPGSVLEALRAALGGMIAAAPGKAMESLAGLESQLPQPARRHVQGIEGYLEKGLAHLRDHWWDELKNLGWTLLWPWPTVATHVSGIWDSIKDLGAAASRLQVSRAIDDWLKIQQDLNAIVGAVYGWFFIASVLVGGVIGAFFGGAGAIPGALAGAAFAGEVGEGLVLALLATEAAVITKSVVDLSRGENTPAEDDTDYQHIAGSTLTISVTGAMMLLGELAGQLAKAIWNGVKGLVRGGSGEAPAVAGKLGAGEPEPVGCFVAGTVVATPEGPRAIETLSLDEKVYAGTDHVEVVVALHSREAPGTVLLTAGGTVIECTPEHPFWAGGSRWTPAGSLRPGDTLLGLDGREVPVTAVRPVAAPRTVFNLTVSGVHMYHVSPATVLVHNKSREATFDPPEVAEVRSAAETNLNVLEGRANAAMERAQAMPADAPGRAQLIDEAAQLKERFAQLHDDVADASDATGIRSHEAGTDTARAELEKLEQRVEPGRQEAGPQELTDDEKWAQMQQALGEQKPEFDPELEAEGERDVAAEQARRDHAKQRKQEARQGDPKRQVGNPQEVVDQGRRFHDTESDNTVYVLGDRVVVRGPNNEPVSQFTNTRANTEQRILDGKWVPEPKT
jgi:hypothetical protein